MEMKQRVANYRREVETSPYWNPVLCHHYSDGEIEEILTAQDNRPVVMVNEIFSVDDVHAMIDRLKADGSSERQSRREARCELADLLDDAAEMLQLLIPGGYQETGSDDD